MALPSLIPELEEVILRGSPARRAETLQRVADLFIEGAARYTEEHVHLFDAVLGRLVTEIETKARAELARRLAPVGNAPTGVIWTLAQDDDIAVAGPVLVRSERLAESHLLALARSKSQAHLLAISNRADIGEAVTDVLIRRGDREVVRTVAENRRAKLSETSYASLIRRAERDGVLAEKIGTRPDIPPHLFHALVARATEVVRQRLRAVASPEMQAEISRVLAKVSQELDAAAPRRNAAAAQEAVRVLQQAGRLDEGAIQDFARTRRVDHAVAGVAALCALPFDVVDQLMTGERADPILILCKVAGLGWPTARTLIALRPGVKGTSSHSLDAAYGNFDRLTLTTAQRVVRFWQTRRPDGGFPGAAR